MSDDGIELPDEINGEVKFTTGDFAVIPLRELLATQSDRPSSLALIAAMFWNGDRETEGRWFSVDVVAGFPGHKGESLHVSQKDLLRLSRQQTKLSILSESINGTWPRLLNAYRESAEEDLERLRTQLERDREDNSLRRKLQNDAIPRAQTRADIQHLLEIHTESVVGGLFQVFFAYLLALEGYKNVVSNQVGVPDVKATGLKSTGVDLGRWSREDVDHLICYSRQAGDDMTVDRLMALVRSSESAYK